LDPLLLEPVDRRLLGYADGGSRRSRIRGTGVGDHVPQSRNPAAGILTRMSSSSTGDMARVEKELLARWPESRLEPSLTRINALVDLLGAPHRAMPVIQVAGTNGKTTTARMIDELLRGFGLRVGRFTSPHLQ